MISFLADVLAFVRDEVARVLGTRIRALGTTIRSTLPRDVAALAATKDAPQLVEALHDRRPKVRKEALAALRDISTPAGFVAIARVVADRDPEELADEALQILRHHDAEVFNALRNATMWVDANITQAARFSDVSHQDPNPFTLVYARMGTDMALDALAIEADDARRNVLVKVRTLGAEEFDVLTGLLRRRPGPIAQDRVIERLLERGEARAIEPLLFAYEHADDAHMTRRTACDAISRLLAKTHGDVPTPLLERLAALKGLPAFHLDTNRSFRVDTSTVREIASKELQRRATRRGT